MLKVLTLGHADMDSWPLSCIGSICSGTPLGMSLKAPNQALGHYQSLEHPEVGMQHPPQACAPAAFPLASPLSSLY